MDDCNESLQSEFTVIEQITVLIKSPVTENTAGHEEDRALVSG